MSDLLEPHLPTPPSSLAAATGVGKWREREGGRAEKGGRQGGSEEGEAGKGGSTNQANKVRFSKKSN